MTLHLAYVGCDISKRSIDVFDPRSGARRIANTSEACTALADELAGAPVVVVVMEATAPTMKCSAARWHRPASHTRASIRCGRDASPRPPG